VSEFARAVDVCADDGGASDSAGFAAKEELERLIDGHDERPASTVCLRVDRRGRRVVAALHTGHHEGAYRWCLDVRSTDERGRLLPGTLLPVVQLNPIDRVCKAE
jgi:hypothetical protein